MAAPRSQLMVGFAALAALSTGALTALHGGAAGIAAVLMAGQLLICVALLVLALRSFNAAADAHRRAQESLRQQLFQCRAGTQAIIDALAHGVALLAPDGAVDMANSRGEWFGMTPGSRIENLPHPKIKSLVEAAFKTRQHAGSDAENPASADGLVQMFDEGRELFFRPLASPLLDAAGNLTGVAVILVDVTSARHVDEAKSSLVSSFSHELKTPMTSIQMSLYLLVDDAAGRLTPRQMELLTAARDDADRLHRLVEEMLSAARGKN